MSTRKSCRLRKLPASAAADILVPGNPQRDKQQGLRIAGNKRKRGPKTPQKRVRFSSRLIEGQPSTQRPPSPSGEDIPDPIPELNLYLITQRIVFDKWVIVRCNTELSHRFKFWEFNAFQAETAKDFAMKKGYTAHLIKYTTEITTNEEGESHKFPIKDQAGWDKVLRTIDYMEGEGTKAFDVRINVLYSRYPPILPENVDSDQESTDNKGLDVEVTKLSEEDEGEEVEDETEDEEVEEALSQLENTRTFTSTSLPYNSPQIPAQSQPPPPQYPCYYGFYPGCGYSAYNSMPLAPTSVGYPYPPPHHPYYHGYNRWGGYCHYPSTPQPPVR